MGYIQGWKIPSKKPRYFKFLKTFKTPEVQNLGLWVFIIFLVKFYADHI